MKATPPQLPHLLGTASGWKVGAANGTEGAQN